jgi:hypothetical protein
MQLSELSKLLRIYDVTEEEFFSRKIQELFDPDAIAESSSEERLVATLAALTPPRGKRCSNGLN